MALHMANNVLMEWLGNVNSAVQSAAGDDLGVLFNFQKATPHLRQNLALAAAANNVRADCACMRD